MPLHPHSQRWLAVGSDFAKEKRCQLGIFQNKSPPVRTSLLGVQRSKHVS